MKTTPLLFLTIMLCGCLGGTDKDSTESPEGGSFGDQAGGTPSAPMDSVGGMPTGEPSDRVTFPALATQAVDVSLTFTVSSGGRTHIIGAPIMCVRPPEDTVNVKDTSTACVARAGNVTLSDGSPVGIPPTESMGALGVPPA